MKLLKSPVTPGKSKPGVAVKGKFKSKDHQAESPVQKGAKKVAGMIKRKSSIGSEMEGMLKSKRSTPKLSPQVQLGLKLDAMLENAQLSPGSTPKKKSCTPSNAEEYMVNGQRLYIIKTSNPSSPSSDTKKGKKRKSMTDTSLLGEDSQVGSVLSSTPVTQNKSNKKKKGGGKKTAESSESDHTLNSEDILNAVVQAVNLYKKENENKKLLHDSTEPILLSFILHLPDSKKKHLRFELAHSLVTDTADICLFVSDIEKNPDDTKSNFQEVLKEEGVTNITEVIPLRSLMKDYTQFEDKRKLSNRFEFFLVDCKVAHRVFPLCGHKFFHSRRKTPSPVKLTKGKMNERIQSALKKVAVSSKPASNRFTVQVGHIGMEPSLIRDNIMKVWEAFPQVYGVYWENIHKAVISGTNVPDLPFYISPNPPRKGARVYIDKTKGKKQGGGAVYGELSTQPDCKVVVFPTGQVKVLKKAPGAEKSKGKKSKKDKKKNKKVEVKEENGTEPAGEDRMSEDEASLDEDGMAEDSGEEVEEKENPTDKKNKKNKKKKQEGWNEEADDDVAKKAEELYLKYLQREKTKTKDKGEEQEEEGDGSSDDDMSDDDDDDAVSLDDQIGEDSSGEEEDVKPVAKQNKQNQKKKGPQQKQNQKQSNKQADDKQQGNKQVGKGQRGKGKKGGKKGKGGGKFPTSGGQSTAVVGKPVGGKKEGNSFQGIKTDQKTKISTKKRPNRKNKK